MDRPPPVTGDDVPLAGVGLLALAGGLVLGLVAGLWGRTPAGNTALVVPFGGGPALIAAGWAALAVGRPGLALAALTGLTALPLALGAVFAPLAVPGGPSAPALGWLLVVPTLLAVPAGLWLARVAGRVVTARTALVTLGAGVVLAVLLLAPTGLGPLLAPFGPAVVLVVPFFATGAVTGGTRLAVGLVGAPVLVALGVLVGGRLTGPG